MELNQCDGCRCGWVLSNGVHRDPNGRNHIGCTKYLYVPKPVDMNCKEKR